MHSICSDLMERGHTIWVGAAMAALMLAASPAHSRQSGSDQTPAEAVDYVVSVGDVLELFVWREPELSREVVVRIDGRISVPLIGEIEAAGKTPREVGREVADGMKLYIDEPLVTVTVRQANARVFVVGLVRNPGEYPHGQRLTVAKVLALAGGFVDYAKRDRILVIREASEGPPETIQVNFEELEKGERLEQNVVLNPGDTIIVP